MIESCEAPSYFLFFPCDVDGDWKCGEQSALFETAQRRNNSQVVAGADYLDGHVNSSNSHIL